MEAKLFEGDTAHVSTFAFHEHRERAPHLEQPVHRRRLERAAQLVSAAAVKVRALYAAEWTSDTAVYVSDLGCGDGGLLQLLKLAPEGITAWGYDFAPANAAGWAERGVDGRAADVFGADQEHIALGEIAVMTEVLEHLTDPHGALQWLADHVDSPDFLVCSSPWTETAESHDACHAWAWDREGYAAMLTDAGWEIEVHDTVGMFQVVLARRADV